MAGQSSSRAKWIGALLALSVVLAYPACNLANDARLVADAAPAEKSKPERDCRKRTDGQHTPANKACPDGGERLPQDRRSPLDSLPPLAPLVA